MENMSHATLLSNTFLGFITVCGLFIITYIMFSLSQYRCKLLNLFVKDKQKRYTKFINFLVRKIAGEGKPNKTFDIVANVVKDEEIYLNCDTKHRLASVVDELFVILWGAYYMSNYTFKYMSLRVQYLEKDGYGNFKTFKVVDYELDEELLRKINWKSIDSDEFSKLLQKCGKELK